MKGRVKVFSVALAHHTYSGKPGCSMTVCETLQGGVPLILIVMVVPAKTLFSL